MKIHIVQKGDTLFEIAKNYGVNFEDIVKLNSQLSSPDMIMPGMKIKIPSESKQVRSATEKNVRVEAKAQQIKPTEKAVRVEPKEQQVRPTEKATRVEPIMQKAQPKAHPTKTEPIKQEAKTTERPMGKPLGDDHVEPKTVHIKVPKDSKRHDLVSPAIELASREQHFEMKKGFAETYKEPDHYVEKEIKHKMNDTMHEMYEVKHEYPSYRHECETPYPISHCCCCHRMHYGPRSQHFLTPWQQRGAFFTGHPMMPQRMNHMPSYPVNQMVNQPMMNQVNKYGN